MFADELARTASQLELTPHRMLVSGLYHLSLAFQDDEDPRPRGRRRHIPVRRADDREDNPERDRIVFSPKPVVADHRFTCVNCGAGRDDLNAGYECPNCGEVGRYRVRAGALA